MLSLTLPAVAGIGHNQPPLSPFEESETKINDLFGEAQLWLDGAKVDNQQLADGIGNLLKMLRDAKKLADEHRKAEAEPFDKGKAEVQARYKPLLDKADLATAACKKALEPWLRKVTEEIEAKARQERAAAEAKRLAAEKAIRSAEPANLGARAAAEALILDAKRAKTTARKAERKTATAGGAFGRAATLRTVYVAVMSDPVLAARHVWTVDRDAIHDFLQNWADQQVRLGKRELPGFEITPEKIAV